MSFLDFSARAGGLVSAPHTFTDKKVASVMSWVMIALVPATLYGFWLYGWPSIFLWIITLAFTLMGEAFCLRLMQKPLRSALFDGSAALTGWLLAISLPPWAPWWIGAFGGLFAAVFGKQVFGGLGQNAFNPAMVARVALLVSFPVPMTAWIKPLPITGAEAPSFISGLQITISGLPRALDAISSATVLGFTKTEMTRGVDLLHSLANSTAPLISETGYRMGSLGETASFLLLAGGLLLLWLRIISWHIPVSVLLGIGVPALIAHGADPAHFLGAPAHILSGGAVLCAFFIATDYVTSPATPGGQLIFGAGVGFLTWVIRTWGGYPEGVAFAILLMNTLTPVIDRVTRPRIFGRRRNGTPLEIDKVV